MRLIALLVVVSFSLTACGGGSTSVPTPSVYTAPQVQLTGTSQTVDSFTDSTATATSASGLFVPLFAIQNLQTNQGQFGIVFWGTKDSTGEVLQLTEAGLSENGTANRVHVFFDTSSRPVLFRDDVTGYSIQLSYDSATQMTVTLCDARNSIVAADPITFGTGTPQAGSAGATGSCVARNAASSARRISAVGATSGVPSGATNVTDAFAGIRQFITSAAYVAGVSLAQSAILSFAAHKDNPTQVPISKGIALLFVATALIYLPAAFASVGGTIYGDSTSVAGVEGLALFQSPRVLPGCNPTAPVNAPCPLQSP